MPIKLNMPHVANTHRSSPGRESNQAPLSSGPEFPKERSEPIRTPMRRTDQVPLSAVCLPKPWGLHSLVRSRDLRLSTGVSRKELLLRQLETIFKQGFLDSDGFCRWLKRFAERYLRDQFHGGATLPKLSRTLRDACIGVIVNDPKNRVFRGNSERCVHNLKYGLVAKVDFWTNLIDQVRALKEIQTRIGVAIPRIVALDRMTFPRGLLITEHVPFITDKALERLNLGLANHLRQQGFIRQASEILFNLGLRQDLIQHDKVGNWGFRGTKEAAIEWKPGMSLKPEDFIVIDPVCPSLPPINSVDYRNLPPISFTTRPLLVALSYLKEAVYEMVRQEDPGDFA